MYGYVRSVLKTMNGRVRYKILKSLDGLTYKQAIYQLLSALEIVIKDSDSLEVRETCIGYLNQIKEEINVQKELHSLMH